MLNWCIRGWRERAYLSHWPERFGFLPATRTQTLWVHAVSAGEVQASVPLVKLLAAQHPKLALLVTTATPAGRLMAQSLYPQARVHYLPIDLPGCVRRFFVRVRPVVGVILETEIWPNLYAGAVDHGVPLVLVSARLSARSVGRYQRVKSWVSSLLANVTIAAQSESDAQRFCAIGAHPSRVSVCGNLKFDYQVPESVVAKAQSWRQSLAVRPVWVAGSTHAVEEDAVLAAHEKVLAQFPTALLILVPRHPPRFAVVEQRLKDSGRAYAVRRQTDAAVTNPAADVWLIATLGELVCAYAAADVAFVGGTLVPIGGHNLLEPAAVARPVLFGPFISNARLMAEVLEASAGGQTVGDADALAAAVKAYFQNPELGRRAGQAAYQAISPHRGAAARTFLQIDPWLGKSKPDNH